MILTSMTLSVCSYNIEDFFECFNEANEPKTESKDEAKKLQSVATVLENVDADLIGVVEGPQTVKADNSNQSTVKALQKFAAEYDLRQNQASMGYPAQGERELAVMYDESVIKSVEHIARSGADSSVPPFNGEFVYDTDNDGIDEVYDFYRPPFEAEVTLAETNETFRLILAHVKSKVVYGVMDRIRHEQESMGNRRQIFAQCTWIRRRVEKLMEDHPVVVMGDFNDGPGFDYYERQFGKSGIEIVVGDLFNPDGVLSSAYGRPTWEDYADVWNSNSAGWIPYTASFRDEIEGGYMKTPVDYVLATDDLEPTNGQIWNPLRQPDLQATLYDASDHFPVSVDLAGV